MRQNRLSRFSIAPLYLDLTLATIARSFVGSMVDVWPLRGWGVRYGSTNQANSAFHPSGVGKWVVIHGLQGRRPLNGRPGLRMAVSPGRGPWARSVCDTNSALQIVSRRYAIQIHLYLLTVNAGLIVLCWDVNRSECTLLQRTYPTRWRRPTTADLMMSLLPQVWQHGRSVSSNADTAFNQ